MNITGLVDASIVSSTVAFNRSPGWGNGIFARARQGSTVFGDTKVTLHNTIVAHNFADNATYANRRNLWGKYETASSHNLISFDPDSTNGINDGGNGNIVGESSELLAGLAPLGDYGGPLLPDGTHILTHALALGSRAIDQGDSSVAENYHLSFDQRGEDRVAIGSAVDEIDIGAFELQSPEDAVVLVTTKIDQDDAFNTLNPQASYDSLSLREAVDLVSNDPVGASNTIQFSPYFSEMVSSTLQWNSLMSLASITVERDTELNADGFYESETLFEIPEQTFLLTNGPIALDTDVEIVGWGTNILAVNGNDQSRVFQIDSGGEAALSSLKITGGDAGSSNGGGINNQGDLFLTDVHIIENEAYRGGGLYSDGGGTATIIRSMIEDNSATLAGGIDQVAGELYIKDSTIRGNVASYSTGGVFVREEAYASVVGSLFVDNRAALYGRSLCAELGRRRDQLDLLR